jgi:hypothetical protein
MIGRKGLLAGTAAGSLFFLYAALCLYRFINQSTMLFRRTHPFYHEKKTFQYSVHFLVVLTAFITSFGRMPLDRIDGAQSLRGGLA